MRRTLAFFVGFGAVSGWLGFGARPEEIFSGMHRGLVVFAGFVVTWALAVWALEWATERLARSWQHWPAFLRAYLDIRRQGRRTKGGGR